MVKERIGWLTQNGMILLIRAYQAMFAIFFGPCCRFTPTCSCYAIESIQRFGAVEGCWKTLKRILRCHPFNPGGYDPVSETPAGDSNSYLSR
jgi:uncharacterized protein